MRAGAPWSLPPLCSSFIHDQHRDLTSVVLRLGRADAYRVHHSANLLIVAASAPFPSSFIHLHDIVSLPSSSSSKRSAPLRYTHTPISPLPNPFTLSLSLSPSYRRFLPLSPSGLLVVISCLSLSLSLSHSPLALYRPLCRSLALTRQAQATRVLLPSCATRARALVGLNSDRTSATPSAQVAAPVTIVSPTLSPFSRIPVFSVLSSTTLFSHPIGGSSLQRSLPSPFSLLHTLCPNFSSFSHFFLAYLLTCLANPVSPPCRTILFPVRSLYLPHFLPSVLLCFLDSSVFFVRCDARRFPTSYLREVIAPFTRLVISRFDRAFRDEIIRAPMENRCILYEKERKREEKYILGHSRILSRSNTNNR